MNPPIPLRQSLVVRQEDLAHKLPTIQHFGCIDLGNLSFFKKKMEEKISYSMIRAMECCELEISLASQSLAFLTPSRTSWH